MKKLMVIFLALFSFFVLNACGSNQIPDDATVAVCTQGDTFKYIYKDDKIYEFYSNDELQSDDILDIVKTAAGSFDNFRAYLDSTFIENSCVFTTYNSSKE